MPPYKDPFPPDASPSVSWTLKLGPHQAPWQKPAHVASNMMQHFDGELQQRSMRASSDLQCFAHAVNTSHAGPYSQFCRGEIPGIERSGEQMFSRQAVLRKALGTYSAPIPVVAQSLRGRAHPTYVLSL